MQAQKLHDDQEQADNAGQAGIQQILPFLSQTHIASGNEVDTYFCRGRW
jgi:hypothetical protein